MTDSRMLVVDASHSLFRTGSTPKDKDQDALLLKPIPEFQKMLSSAIGEHQTKNVPGRIVGIDIGVICDISAVRNMVRILHASVLQKLLAAT